MGRYLVKLPDVGEGTTEAEIVAWHVAPGQEIREDDPLVDVMTDKATVEIPTPVAGTVVTLHGAVGDKRPVGSELVLLDVAGQGNVAESTVPPVPEAAPAKTMAAAARTAGPELVEGPPASQPAAVTAAPHRTGKPLASPAVRRRAWDLGIALQFVPGTGPGGRITRQDLDAYAAASARPGGPAPGMQPDETEPIPITGLRRAIAEHMQGAKRHIPHFSYIEEVDVSALEDLRGALNTRHDDRGHLTLLPFLMRAIVRAVADQPDLNARFDDEAGILHRHRAVHIGVATQTGNGLLVPVVRHAEALDLWQSAAELRRLADAARAGKAARAELSGSTITITSLGALGGLAATPVINHPEVAIVGVNRIAERPVVRDGQIVVRKMMNLSSSFDHRIVDGWAAASFIQRLKRDLEQPALLFVG
ncbi:MAG TPA: dihydrolipoamide acetyltransferase family protein [Stellaceae bacterium]|nr:dihydrolipoamide acetyltransferase family protein [Stellaceae bacterium]